MRVSWLHPFIYYFIKYSRLLDMATDVHSPDNEA
jgi:hypothetical protein